MIQNNQLLREMIKDMSEVEEKYSEGSYRRCYTKKIVKEIGGIMGGGGGGKSHIATAGGSDVNLLQDALDYGISLIEYIFSDK